MFSQTMSFRNGCCRDSSAVILFEGSSVSIRSNRSNASAGILKENKQTKNYTVNRVVSRFLSRRFHPKSRQLFPFCFSNITLRTDLLTFIAMGAVFQIEYFRN